MPVWLVPVCLFPILMAIYLGALRVDLSGGNGLRQVLGVIDSYVLFLVVWVALRWALGLVGGFFWHFVVATVLTVLLLPLIVRAGCFVMGVRVQRIEPGH